MKIRPIIGGILGLATVATMAAPADAQRRVCVINERNRREIVCGPEASEIPNQRDRRDRYDRDRGRYDRRDVERRVSELYVDVLGRRADRGGLNAYSNRVINDGWNYDRVRRELAQSREAREAIDRIYREVLGRSADRSGLAAYQGALERGWSLRQVREDLSRSQEALRDRRDRR